MQIRLSVKSREQIKLSDPYGDAYDNMKRIDARKIKVGTAFENPQTGCLFSCDFEDAQR